MPRASEAENDDRHISILLLSDWRPGALPGIKKGGCRLVDNVTKTPKPRSHSHSEGCPIRCEQCLSRAKGVFGRLERPALARLDVNRATRRVRRGETLYVEGDRLENLYCLRAGSARLLRATAEGWRYVLRVARAGDVLGLENLALGGLATSTAEMLEDGLVCVTDRRAVLDLLLEEPTLARAVLEALSEQLRASDEDRLLLSSRTALVRTARLLALLTESHGVTEADGVRIHLPLTRRALGEMIGAAPETISRAIQHFRRDGILDGRAKQIRILDPARLRDLAAFESDPH
jgi:CRP/FNR family transcriptional regulator